MIRDGFQPPCFECVKSTLAVNEFLATHVNWAVGIAEDDASASADDENTYEKDEK